MIDVETWNSGKTEFMEDFIQEPDAVDIFSLRALKPKSFLKHRFVLGYPSQTLSPVFVQQGLYNNGYDFFIGNMSLSFKASAINGIGTVAYCDFLGYAAIERMTIKVGDAEFIFDGEYFFNKIMSLDSKLSHSILHDAGHNDDCRRVSTSVDLYEEIKPSQTINVLLPLPFGTNVPKNLLPLAVNDNIRVEFIMQHMSKLVNCDKASNLKIDGFSDFKLSIELYTRKSGLRPVYEPRIDLPLSTVLEESKGTISVKSSRYLSIIQKCPLSDKAYPVIINNWKSEEDVVAQFLSYLVDNLIYIVETSKVEKLKEQFPETAKLVEVINGEAIIRTSPQFNQKRIVTVSIRDIPDKHTVLYHSNLLVINKTYKEDIDKKLKPDTMQDVWTEDFNISEKLISVVGYYDVVTKKVVPIKVNHILSSQHASIPLDVFQELGEDNRLLTSNSYIIRSFFSNGPNMFSPRPLLGMMVYYSAKDTSKIIYNAAGGSVINKLLPYSPYEYIVEFSHPQNDSRFSFKNLNKGTFVISVDSTKFNVLKSELVKEFKQNKEFREPRHKEEGFESLYPKLSYKVTCYNSSQISQSVSSSGDKITTYIQSV